jgi:hypothetical protein
MSVAQALTLKTPENYAEEAVENEKLGTGYLRVAEVIGAIEDEGEMDGTLSRVLDRAIRDTGAERDSSSCRGSKTQRACGSRALRANASEAGDAAAG